MVNKFLFLIRNQLCYSNRKKGFKEPKGVIRCRNSKKKAQCNDQKKHPLKAGVNSGAPEGLTVPAQLVTPVVFITVKRHELHLF